MLHQPLRTFGLNTLLHTCGWLMFIAALTSCGFHLRQPAPIVFKTIQLTGSSQLMPTLRKSLTSQGIQLVENSEEAELRVELLKDENEKRILSLSGTGVVREYELYYRVHFRTKTASDATWALPMVMEARRDYTYNDSSLLAKQAEEKRLTEGMQTDVLNGIMRRLSALKKAE